MSKSKISPEMVQKLRELAKQGLPNKAIAEQTGVAFGSVCRFCVGFKSALPAEKKPKAAKQAKPKTVALPASGEYVAEADFYRALNEKHDVKRAEMDGNGVLRQVDREEVFLECVKVPSQQNAEEFLLDALKGKMDLSDKTKANMINGVDKWIREYYAKHPDKIENLAVISTTEEFYEELKKPHFIRKREDGVMVETGEKKTFLETTTNPTLPKAMMFLKDALRKKIEKTNKGEPVELINIGKACSRFITEYTQEFKLNTPEYKALDDEFYDVV